MNQQKTDLILNIQKMQNFVYGYCLDFESFNGNTINELINLQYIAIEEYNAAIQLKQY